jgi:Transposase and inactivated derivatives, TnpA family
MFGYARVSTNQQDLSSQQTVFKALGVPDDLEKITTNGDDMTRVAASLVTGSARAYDLLRMFTHDNGSPSSLGAAVIEYGHIANTLHLLSLIDPTDETYRRAINSQLTVQESRHRLARAISHGRRGQSYQRYREG